MTMSPFTPLAIEACFAFACHSGLACFNQCCRDLNQALTPYDVVRLKNALEMRSGSFLARYVDIRIGPATGLPVASLRFADPVERTCPFVSTAGCRVYAHRPASCRLYPLTRGVRRSRHTGARSEYYALLKEDHCRGFEAKRIQSVRQWVADQGLADYFGVNDILLDLISLKNRLRPGPLPPEAEHLTRLAFYDVDGLKESALAGDLPGVDDPALTPLPTGQDDVQWLLWGQRWIRWRLFGGRS